MTANEQETQPAIFTVYAWHQLEDARLELMTHLVAAHSSEKAEMFMRKHQPHLLENAECFIATDFVLDHLEGFGACHWYANTITKGEPLSEYEFDRWVRSHINAVDDDGEVAIATIRAIQ